jgi:serine/threonine protein kinase
MDPNKHQNALNLNDRLHWYEIKSILGQGGFGITYIAHDTNLDHDVAIKEYLPVECSTRNLSGEVQPVSEDCSEIFEWGKARFLEEARTLFQFKHKNIVRVLSFFEANNTGYMVMEYVQGMDFSDLIALGEPFSESELLGIIIPILDGLELVHDQGFIHRDIKPQNIVLHSDGHPVLIDFGSARQADITGIFTVGTIPSRCWRTGPVDRYLCARCNPVRGSYRKKTRRCAATKCRKIRKGTRHLPQTHGYQAW